MKPEWQMYWSLMVLIGIIGIVGDPLDFSFIQALGLVGIFLATIIYLGSRPSRRDRIWLSQKFLPRTTLRFLVLHEAPSGCDRVINETVEKSFYEEWVRTCNQWSLENKTVKQGRLSNQLLYWNVFVTDYGRDHCEGVFLEVFGARDQPMVYAIATAFAEKTTSVCGVFESPVLKDRSFVLKVMVSSAQTFQFQCALEQRFDSATDEWSLLKVEAVDNRNRPPVSLLTALREQQDEVKMFSEHASAEIPCPACTGLGYVRKDLLPRAAQGLSGRARAEAYEFAGKWACETCGGQGALLEDWYHRENPNEKVKLRAKAGSGFVRTLLLPRTQHWSAFGLDP